MTCFATFGGFVPSDVFVVVHTAPQSTSCCNTQRRHDRSPNQQHPCGEIAIEGPAGPVGPARPTGPTGPTGPEGPAGPTGPAGASTGSGSVGGWTVDVNHENEWTLTPPGGGSAALGIKPSGHVSAMSFCATSDIKYKKHIQDLPPMPKVIDGLRPVSFTWKDSQAAAWGFVAQEVHQVAPQLVEDKCKDHLQLRVLEFLPVMVRELQDLRRRCRNLEKRLV